MAWDEDEEARKANNEQARLAAMHADPKSVATYRDAVGEYHPAPANSFTEAALNDPSSAKSKSLYYGGQQDAADADVNRYRGFATNYYQRGGVQLDKSNVNADRAMGLSARDSQVGALNAYRDAANGVGTSVAQAQYVQALQQQQAAQASAANSARGGGLARAAAQDTALNNSAAMGQNSAASMASLRAEEIAQARQGYGAAAQALRGGDLSQQGADTSIAAQQAGLDMGSRQQNDSMWLASEGLGQGVRAAQQQAGASAANVALHANDTEAGISSAAQAAALQQQAQNNQQTAQWTGATLAGLGTLAAFSDERVKHDIHPATEKMKAFLDAMKAHEYSYNSPGSPGQSPGRHVGPMAQELERSEVGRRLVQNTPNGKAVKYGSPDAVASAFAALASLNERLKKLEGKKGKAA